MNSKETKYQPEKVWSGRFKKATDSLMERFNQSIAFDIRLWRADVQVNLAWAKALAKIGVFSPDELRRILEGLRKIHDEFEKNEFVVLPSDEDIHSAVERRLTEITGSAGARIHTGRSRNDQVATDVRLFCLEALGELFAALHSLQRTVVQNAEQHIDCIMPGYTHLQQAQPLLFSHYLLSLFFCLQRDKERLADCKSRVESLPLGSGALAGSAFAIDREFLARELGFSQVSENSVDAVSDRDFILELINALAIFQIHLSRYCEDFIIWSSAEFGFIELDDAWSTGSSMMPQKKNPDSLELIRGKTARVIGNQTQLHCLMKGLPLTYAKDLQEDKESLFDSIDTAFDCIAVFDGALSSMKINSDMMRQKLDEQLFATDIADYLVKKGLPFRESHRVVANLVRRSIETGQRFSEMPLAEYRQASALFENDVFSIFNWQNSINLRNVDGGTGIASVKKHLIRARQLLKAVETF